MKLIVQNGVEVNPLYKDRILLSNFYEGRETLVTVATGTSAGGQLLADDYYYKVVCVCDKLITIAGDSATQLSAFTLTYFATNYHTLTWTLHDDSGVRVFELWNGNTKVARGTKTGNGVLTFDEIADSGIKGTVNVTYSATDADAANIITIDRNVVVQSEELHIVPSGNLLTADIQMTPIIGNITAVYLYRGMASGVYDGYFLYVGTTMTAALALFSDDGTRSFDFDTSITTTNLVAHREFLPEGYVADIWHPCSSRIAWRFTGDHYFNYIDCTKVINKPTWNVTTEPYNVAAFNEFSSWI